MPDSPPLLTCPVCRSSAFTPSTRGLLIHHAAYTCAQCGSRLEAHGAMFRLAQAAPAYSNAGLLFAGAEWTAEQLAEPTDPAYSDEQLAAMASGAIPPELLTSSGGAPPFELEDGETILFALEHIYSFEDRTPRNPAALRFSYREHVGNWGEVGELPDPRRSYLFDSLDTGTFWLTTRRYAFSGAARSVDEPLAKVAAAVPYSDGLLISRSNTTRAEYYKGGYHWPLIGAVLRGLEKK